VNNPRRITLKALKDEKKFPRQSNVVTISVPELGESKHIREYPGGGDELINAPVSFVHNIRSTLLTIA
jgi:sulfite oxidase